MAFVPLEPELATVVTTEIPVDAVLVLDVVEVSCSVPNPDPPIPDTGAV